MRAQTLMFSCSAALAIFLAVHLFCLRPRRKALPFFLASGHIFPRAGGNIYPHACITDCHCMRSMQSAHFCGEAVTDMHGGLGFWRKQKGSRLSSFARLFLAALNNPIIGPTFPPAQIANTNLSTNKCNRLFFF